jgi:hypothetical protein
MTKNKTIYLLIITLLLASSLLSACSSEPTAIPLAERDLNQVMLRQADLPAGFDQVIEGDPEQLFPEITAVHIGVVNSGSTILKTADDRRVFSNGVLVYDTDEHANQAYQAIIDQAQGETLTVEPIGDETFALYTTVSSDLILNTIHLAMIMWRTGPAVVILSSADSDLPPDANRMPALAELIQSRLVEPSQE